MVVFVHQQVTTRLSDRQNPEWNVKPTLLVDPAGQKPNTLNSELMVGHFRQSISSTRLLEVTAFI